MFCLHRSNPRSFRYFDALTGITHEKDAGEACRLCAGTIGHGQGAVSYGSRSVGLNVTLIVQLEFAASEVPQLLVWAKPRPVVVLTVMPVKELVCLFVRVTAGGGGSYSLQNVRLVGLRMTLFEKRLHVLGGGSRARKTR